MTRGCRSSYGAAAEGCGRQRGSREAERCCPICYEAMRPSRDDVKILPCSSFSSCPSRFHSSCVDAWLQKEGSCPLCRRRFPSLGPAKQPPALDAAGLPLVTASFVLTGGFVPGSSNTAYTQAPLDALLRRMQEEESWLRGLPAATPRGPASADEPPWLATARRQEERGTRAEPAARLAAETMHERGAHAEAVARLMAEAMADSDNEDEPRSSSNAMGSSPSGSSRRVRPPLLADSAGAATRAAIGLSSIHAAAGRPLASGEPPRSWPVPPAAAQPSPLPRSSSLRRSPPQPSPERSPPASPIAQVPEAAAALVLLEVGAAPAWDNRHWGGPRMAGLLQRLRTQANSSAAPSPSPPSPSPSLPPSAAPAPPLAAATPLHMPMPVQLGRVASGPQLRRLRALAAATRPGSAATRTQVARPGSAAK